MLGPILERIQGIDEKITDASVTDMFEKEDKVAVTIRITIEDSKDISREEVENIKKKIRV